MSTSQAATASRRIAARLVSRPLSERPPATSDRLPALDGVRGLAILLVLAYHFTLGMKGSGLASRLLLKLTATGWCGVDLFFVLSGFLITGILYDARESPNRLRNFYARRALRIFPLYYATLIVAFVLVPVIAARPEGLSAADDAGPWLWSYGTNILVSLRNAWFPLSHFWSLAVEEHFYVFWPALILWCSRKTALRFCALMVVIALTARGWMVANGATLAAYCLTVCRMDALAMGSFLALAAREPGGIAAMAAHARKVAVAVATALGALAVWRWGLHLFDPVIQLVGYLLLDLLFAALIVQVVAFPARGLLAALLTNSSLRWLGLYSYGIYVFNSVFLLIAERSYLLARLVSWSGSTMLGRLVYVSVAASTTLASAWLSWHLLEKHFLKLKAVCPLNAAVAQREARAPR